jgi:hypothetical protein
MVIVRGRITQIVQTGDQFDRGHAHLWVSNDDPAVAVPLAESFLADAGFQWEGRVEVLPLRRPLRWPDSDAERSWQLAEQYGLWPNIHLYPREADNPDPLS